MIRPSKTLFYRIWVTYIMGNRWVENLQFILGFSQVDDFLNQFLVLINNFLLSSLYCSDAMKGCQSSGFAFSL